MFQGVFKRGIEENWWVTGCGVHKNEVLKMASKFMRWVGESANMGSKFGEESTELSFKFYIHFIWTAKGNISRYYLTRDQKGDLILKILIS